MDVRSCWKLLALVAKGKCLLGPNFKEKDKRLFDDGVKAMPKVLVAYMDEAAWPTEPT